MNIKNKQKMMVALSKVSTFLSRDLDSGFSWREADAVNQWIQQNKEQTLNISVVHI